MKSAAASTLPHVRAIGSWVRLLLVLILSGFAATSVLAQSGTAPEPAQRPQVNKLTGAKPNVMLIMDASGSMAFTCLQRPHMAPLYVPCYDPLKPGTEANFAVENNAIAYDPNVRYRLPLTPAGALMPQPPFPSNPIGTASLSSDPIWRPKTGFDVVAAASQGGGHQVINPSNYDRYVIHPTHFEMNGLATGAQSPFPKSAARTDCAGSRCTLDEEKLNYARWGAYHSTRMKAATYGVQRAMAAQGSDFRLSWMTLFDDGALFTPGPAPVPPVMREYNQQTRSQFATWMFDLVPSGGTPLRTSLDIAGRYFENASTSGPWAHTPWSPGSESPSDFLSCRRSFAIMVTDGEWNGNPAKSIGASPSADITATHGEQIVHANGATRYTYVPGDNADPRSRGKADRVSSPASRNWQFAGTLADVAMFYWVRDLMPGVPNNVSAGGPTETAFWQNMVTFTIGLGLQGTLDATSLERARNGLADWPRPVADAPTTVDDLAHAAHAGGGRYLSAVDPTLLQQGLSSILDGVVGERKSEAGVAVTGASLSASGGVGKLVPSYKPGKWWGNLVLQTLAPSGPSAPLWQVVEVDPATDVPTGVTTIPDHASRNIWVGRRNLPPLPFRPAAIEGAGLRSGNIHAPANRMSSLATPEVINYLRGDRSSEISSGGLLRTRAAVLGDIVNSTPVHVRDGEPIDYSPLIAGSARSAWPGWQAIKKSRTRGVVMVGANDGMLHAFRANDGRETFAYVPRGVLPRLHELADPAYAHRYFVDGPLVEADAWISGTAAGTVGTPQWTNLVLGSGGAGARNVFAVRIPNADPSVLNGEDVLWERTNSDPQFQHLGYVTAAIEHGVTLGGQWVAIFGNGFYSETGRAVLYVLDLATGEPLRIIGTPAAGLVVPGQRNTYNGLGGVRAVRDEKRRIVGAYAGDMMGRVWKFDLSADHPSGWRLGNNGAPLFVARDATGAPQPITAPPAVYPRNDQSSYVPSYMVVVGTGRLIDDTDPTNLQTQAVYGLWDRVKFGAPTASDPISRSDLGTRTFELGNPAFSGSAFVSATAASSAYPRGWVLPLTQKAGQRVVYPIVRVNDHVIIQTVTPSPISGEACSADGATASNIVMPAISGSCRLNGYTVDFNGDGRFDDTDGSACVYQTAADGGDALVSSIASSKAMIFTGVATIESVDGLVTGTNTSGTTSLCTSSTSAACQKGPRIRAWRQLFLRGNN